MKSKVSVVIASLGSESLHSTIISLNSGSVVPDEIIVSLVEEKDIGFGDLLPENVKLVISPIKGQVAQRCYGFKHAKFDIVMQIDDDIILEKACLEILRDSITHLKIPVAISPSYFSKKTKEYAYQKPHFRDYFLSFFSNGLKFYQFGKISLAGINFGFSYHQNTELTEVDWLPGGCIIYFKKDLVLESFYPFPGKAYAEDLFHCMKLRQKGVRFFMSSQARVYFEWLDHPETFVSISIGYLKSMRATFAYAKQDQKNRFRLFLYYVFSILTVPLKLISLKDKES